MILTLSIPDALYKSYLEQNPQNPQREIATRLERFKDVPASDRPVVFTGEVRKRIEKAFGGPIEDQEKFAAWAEGLASVSFEGLQVHLRPGQRRLIQGEADHYKEPFEKRAGMKIQEALDQWLGVY